MKKVTIHFFLLFLLLCLKVLGQETDSVANQLFHHTSVFDYFAKNFPQEKIYLHFDNTSYYQGDNIWFKCYVVNSKSNWVSSLSKTLYVELLNPGGEVIDKRTLKIENGQCHGDFTLNRLPFYSGWYEVRAYTKYLLNFGEDMIFSRVLPIFDKPKEEGNWEEKSILKYGYGKYPMIRQKPQKDKKVNLRFFPEGGNLVEGIMSQVAFEATDAYGNPIEITGNIVNEQKEETSRLLTVHEGKGIFGYIPIAEKQKAVVNYKGKKYQFDLPKASPQGFVLQVDNLSHNDSIEIAIQKNKNTPPEELGMTIINGGARYGFYRVGISDNETVRFKIDKAKLLPGVSRIILFNSEADILCDRLIFIHGHKSLNIKPQTEEKTYSPHELVNMEFALTDKDGNPAQPTFSLSVRDGANEVEYAGDIQTSLLLTSEIKGHVRNPSYYFDSDDLTHRTALDLLLMVQGWRRYSWEQMTATEPFELKYRAERGIEVNGKVVSFVRSIPKPNVQVSTFLIKENENKENLSTIFTTDSLGHFSFALDVQDKWNMIFSVAENGKTKDHRILLDRLFNPHPRRYRYTDMQVGGAKSSTNNIDQEDDDEQTEPSTDFSVYMSEDSLIGADRKNKVINLEEVTVTGKKNSKEKNIYDSRSKSIAYYDIRSELDDIKDKNKYIGNDMNQLILNLNNNFISILINQEEHLRYKHKMPLFVINYTRTEHSELSLNRYRQLRPEAIKAIYINENFYSIFRYADPRMTHMEIIDTYGCAVFIETYPEESIPTETRKGVRKTILEGYNQTKEFYSPDYSALPPETDYRRTIYWNPSVTPDTDGKIKITFYNNSRCRKLKINAETVTLQGTIGVYKN